MSSNENKIAIFLRDNWETDDKILRARKGQVGDLGRVFNSLKSEECPEQISAMITSFKDALAKTVDMITSRTPEGFFPTETFFAIKERRQQCYREEQNRVAAIRMIADEDLFQELTINCHTLIGELRSYFMHDDCYLQSWLTTQVPLMQTLIDTYEGNEALVGHALVSSMRYFIAETAALSIEQPGLGSAIANIIHGHISDELIDLFECKRDLLKKAQPWLDSGDNINPQVADYYFHCLQKVIFLEHKATLEHANHSTPVTVELMQALQTYIDEYFVRERELEIHRTNVDKRSKLLALEERLHSSVQSFLALPLFTPKTTAIITESLEELVEIGHCDPLQTLSQYIKAVEQANALKAEQEQMFDELGQQAQQLYAEFIGDAKSRHETAVIEADRLYHLLVHENAYFTEDVMKMFKQTLQNPDKAPGNDMVCPRDVLGAASDLFQNRDALNKEILAFYQYQRRTNKEALKLNETLDLMQNPPSPVTNTPKQKKRIAKKLLGFLTRKFNASASSSSPSSQCKDKGEAEAESPEHRRPHS